GGSPIIADAVQEEKVLKLLGEMDEFMNDDFHTSKVLANMFELVHIINGIKDKHIPMLSADTIKKLLQYFKNYLEDIFGLKDESADQDGKLPGVIDLLIEIRKDAKSRKDYLTSDKIRTQLQSLGINIKDEKDGGMSYSF
ncbi:MAG TPA: DALR domain-containing protein, partial [Flavitalea sp.]|nr:DALR domain-containing protein [Flavitalea sp.]